MGCCIGKNLSLINIKTKIDKNDFKNEKILFKGKRTNNNKNKRNGKDTDNKLSIHKSNDFSIRDISFPNKTLILKDNNKLKINTKKNRFHNMSLSEIYHLFKFLDKSELKTIRVINKNFFIYVMEYIKDSKSIQNIVNISKNKIDKRNNKIFLNFSNEHTPNASTTISSIQKQNNNNSILIDNTKESLQKSIYYDAFTSKPLIFSSEDNVYSPKKTEVRILNKNKNFDFEKKNGSHSSYTISENGHDGNTPSFADDDILSNNESLIMKNIKIDDKSWE